MMVVCVFIVLLMDVTNGYYDYIAPADGNSGIRGVAGERGGQWDVDAYIPPFGLNKHLVLEYYGNYTARVLDRQVSIYAGFKHNMLYSPLPISALGTRYIFASYQDTTEEYHSVLVIAAQSQETNIDVTFRLEGNVTYGGRTYSDGDTLILSLGQYKTVKVRSSYDLSGTVIQSSEPIAVLSEMSSEEYGVIAHDQLLPIKHYGQEYLVTAGDDPAVYQLQIISENNDTQITFNDGSTVFVNDSGIYRQAMELGDRISFNSSRPVMTTLCRVNGTNSRLVVIPPVSLYRRQSVLIWQGVVKVLTKNKESVQVIFSSGYSPVSVGWNDIHYSGFQVGTFAIYDDASVSITSDNAFVALVFRNDNIHNSGYNFSSQQSGPFRSDDYRIPVGSAWAATGEIGGRWHVKSNIPPYSQNSFTVTYNNSGETYKGHVIRAYMYREMSMYGYNGPAAFSLGSLYAQGLKYVVSSCLPGGQYTSLLVIATHSQITDVDITFKLEGNVTHGGRTYSDGETLSLHLDSYRTFTIKSSYDLSGTVITSSVSSVAVFNGFSYRDKVTAFDQLLPTWHYGNEYVVAVNSDERLSELQITTEDSDTQIKFNDGSTVSVDKYGMYRQKLGQNKSLHFTSTKPVMTTLCREGGFGVVPPVSFYVNEVVQVNKIKGGLVAKVIAADGNTELDDIHIFKNSKSAVDVKWEGIPNSRFRVGTVHLSNNHTLFTSKTNFTVMMFSSEGEIFNGGYDNTLEILCDCCGSSCCGPTCSNLIVAVVVLAGVCVLAMIAFGGYVLFRIRKARGRKSQDKKMKTSNMKQKNSIECAC